MDKEHWSDIGETANAAWKFRFMLWASKHLPLCVVEVLAAVIVFFFYLGAGEIRSRSREYLKKVFAAKGDGLPRFAVYRHFLAYALSMMEKIRSWSGAMPFSSVKGQDDDLDDLKSLLDSGKGAFVLCSHLGNMEAMRALADFNRTHSQKKFQVFPVLNFSVTTHFNDLMTSVNPDWRENSFDADSVGIETAVRMREKLAEGNLIAIAADRTSAHARGRCIPQKFLGETALFPEGAFILAFILKAPVYFIFAVREKDLDLASPYEFHVIRARTAIKRKTDISKLAEEFSQNLEKFCLKHPFQWYNFYHFWQKEN